MSYNVVQVRVQSVRAKIHANLQKTLSIMTQKLVLELVLHWLCGPDPIQGFGQHRENYEEQLQSIARLQATCKLDAPGAKLFMNKCWDTMLRQYAVLLKHFNASGDCSRKWWGHERDRSEDLRGMGPQYALTTLQGVLGQYASEKELLFEAGGGDKAAEHYIEYLSYPPVVPQNGYDSPDYTSEDDSDQSDAEGSYNDRWAEEQVRFRQWVENINKQQWLVVATLLQKCPGLRPYGGKLREACQDPGTFEKMWFQAWPPYWKRQVPLCDKSFL